LPANINKHSIFNLATIHQHIAAVWVVYGWRGAKLEDLSWQQKALRRRPKINFKKGKYLRNNRTMVDSYIYIYIRLYI